MYTLDASIFVRDATPIWAAGFPPAVVLLTAWKAVLHSRQTITSF